MKPVIILTPDAMSKKDIAVLKKNDFCVVIAKDPSLVKFMDPIPASSSRTEIEAASIKTLQYFLEKSNEVYQVADIKSRFLRFLITNNSPPTQ